jgi:hypothetical protein
MIRQIVTGLALSSLCAISSPADARWYISHVGAETCVPIDNLDPSNPFTRLYYGAGEMRTPDDFLNTVRSMGMQIREEKTTLPSTHAYIASASGMTKTTMFLLFGDSDICRAAMAMLEK